MSASGEGQVDCPNPVCGCPPPASGSAVSAGPCPVSVCPSPRCGCTAQSVPNGPWKNKKSHFPKKCAKSENEEKKSFQVVGTQVNGCLKVRFESLTQASDEAGTQIRLNKVFTEMTISREVGEEVGQEVKLNGLHGSTPPPPPSKPKAKPMEDKSPLSKQDMFREDVTSTTEPKTIKTVMTTGIAGVGKSFLVRKFILDWAGGYQNQDVDLVFLHTFEDLNVIKDRPFSLIELLHHLNAPLDMPAIHVIRCKCLFIFDGLDESSIPLDFHRNKVVSDITETTSIGTLVTNLIIGNMLPSALIWVTSRPAAASQIPPGLIDRVTEIRGFTEPQREDYFRKRFNRKRANKILAHIRSSRSLHNMCHVPVFCYICSKVLEHHMLKKNSKEPLPITLIEMYTSFMLLTTERKLETL